MAGDGRPGPIHAGKILRNLRLTRVATGKVDALCKAAARDSAAAETKRKGRLGVADKLKVWSDEELKRTARWSLSASAIF